MNNLEYYRIRDYAMYGEPAWWGILCLDKEKKGRVILLSGLQGELKIFLKIEKISEKKNYSDSFIKDFSGKILYLKEMDFPSQNITLDLNEKLIEWIEDKSSESFRKLAKDIKTYNESISLDAYFNSIKNIDKIPTRDPWAYFRYYWSNQKISKNSPQYSSFFLNDEKNLYKEEVEDDGEPGSFELEKV